MFFVKSDEWSYEREWRVVKNIRTAETKILDGEISLFDIPKNSITGVFLGAACSKELEEKIIELMLGHGLTFPVRKMTLNANNYNIDDINLTEWINLKKEISDSDLLPIMNEIRGGLYKKSNE